MKTDLNVETNGDQQGKPSTCLQAWTDGESQGQCGEVVTIVKVISVNVIIVNVIIVKVTITNVIFIIVVTIFIIALSRFLMGRQMFVVFIVFFAAKLTTIHSKVRSSCLTIILLFWFRIVTLLPL